MFESSGGTMKTNPIGGPKFAAFMIVACSATTRSTVRRVILAAAVALGIAPAAFAANLSDPSYQEGFGQGATGGAGKAVCTVTSSAATGPGSFEACFDTAAGGNPSVNNKTIVFAVDTLTARQNMNVGSNVTIDGCANGKNGVTFDNGGVGDDINSPSQSPNKRTLYILDSGTCANCGDNVIIRCINFVGFGFPNVENTHPATTQPEYNFIWLIPTFAGTISNVLIDRNTFTRATNKSVDITGGGGDGTGTVTNVTLQRNLFHDNAYNGLVKYAGPSTGPYSGCGGTCFPSVPAQGQPSGLVKQNITYHHNVYVHNGERSIAQIKDQIDLIEIVNNAVMVNGTDLNDPSSLCSIGVGWDGTCLTPYGLRIWSSSRVGQVNNPGEQGADPTYGNVTANILGNAWLGDRGWIEVRLDFQASLPLYIDNTNYFDRAGNKPGTHYFEGTSGHPYADDAVPVSNPSLSTFPYGTLNTVPTAYQVSQRFAPSEMATGMLPHVGAPNRTALDTQRLNELAAQLPNSGLPVTVRPGHKVRPGNKIH